MNVQSYSTVKKCYAALKNLGCRITPAIKKEFAARSVYVYQDTYIFLDEFKLLD